MSASRPGNMRGPWVKTPLLLLLLLLLITLTGTVSGQSEGDYADPEAESTDDSDPAEADADPAESLLTESTVSDATLPPEPPEDPAITEEYVGSGFTESSFLGPEEPNPSGYNSTADEDEQNLTFVVIPALVVLVVVVIGMIVCGIFINRKWNNKRRSQELRKDDPYLDGPDTEKVPMPMFEEDVPSVLELEMEELDQWMKKDGETAEGSNHG
ncbi:transmembrane protein 154 isoform X2 [Solea solea]|uniref:transmembrane protein 154 isoform X2 n=1 Tax=Solea solea TaxID=90069 RepID=UPI002729E452|nr:transmembrane protein 154 isoform X2 [Solea solea]